ncbi:chemotaxis response regulator protein-glutamate methylesterase [Oscillospiraceae bacterium OttesenSCG-928-G22]|nr:chemotaxis response regulator protein-glutamate methylesterase [Oscillospiraceae bacterium OttesenSCG-928-G22]
MPPKKTRVLIVDDSVLIRKALTDALSRDPALEVCGTAADPYEARDRIVELLPDVVVIDIEMPYMNGVEFIKILMPQWPVPVVVASSEKRMFQAALDAGAVDCLQKPTDGSPDSYRAFTQELAKRVRLAPAKFMTKTAHQTLQTGGGGGYAFSGIIAIGASTGGTQATTELMKQLPGDLPGIVIVQHMPPVFTDMYAESLNKSCKMHVKEAKDGMQVQKGFAYVAPGDKHLKVIRADGGYAIKCYAGEKVSGHCPSVDVLFHSVAEACGKDAVGIILTGMGADGAKGLLAMRRAGAFTIGQDEKSSVVYGMPKEAYEIGAVKRQAPLSDIPGVLMQYVRKKA